MAGIANHRLLQHLLVIIASAWLPISTMAVPPCCCTFAQGLFELSAGACCCPAGEPENSAPHQSPAHRHRHCGCSVESIPGTLPEAVVAVNVAEDFSAELQLQANSLSLGINVPMTDETQPRNVGSQEPRCAAGTCVALCRFLC